MAMKYCFFSALHHEAYVAPQAEELAFGTEGMLCISLEDGNVDPGQGEDWGDF